MLARDYQRLQHFVKFQQLLATGSQPALTSGSFIAGYSNSTWNSWTENLAADFGSQLPIDPLNEWSGICSPAIDPNNAYYDSQTCYTKDPPKLCGAGHDECTSFSCPDDSFVYHYYYDAANPENTMFYGQSELFLNGYDLVTNPNQLIHWHLTPELKLQGVSSATYPYCQSTADATDYDLVVTADTFYNQVAP